jgi:preprotein translocase subunit YajC
MSLSVYSSSFFQNVQPKQGTPGVADPSGAAPAGDQHAPASSGPGGGSMITMLLPFLILVPFLFMSFRRQKKEQEARKGLKKGDKVVTQSGLIGELVELEPRIAKVKIAPGTTVQVLASTVSMFDATADAKGASKTDKDLADLKEAKAGAGDKK